MGISQGIANLLGSKEKASFLINVTYMFPGHAKEVIEDLLEMHKKNMVQAAVFSFTLVPEGNPVTDKATRLVELFREYQSALKDCGFPVGILLQATVGHGWAPQEKSAFQKFVFRSGTGPYIHCPLDTGFQEYIARSVRIVAETHPDFIMLDDDARALTGRGGCFCPLHIRGFNEAVQANYTADELREAIVKDDKVARKWDIFQQSAFLELAKSVRAGIDAVDPEMPGMFCCCYGDVRHAKKMGQILAAKGQTPIVRLNNALYLYDSAQVFPAWMYKTAIQVAALEGCIVLAETDTCPQKRYATSYQMLHTHYSWSLLNGCIGGKLWVTSSSYNPRNGVYYRKKLAEYHGFYDEVARMRPEFQGFIEPMPQESPFNAAEAPGGYYLKTLGGDVIAELGLPFAYNKRITSENIVVLTGSTVKFFSDDELRTFLAGRVFLEGEAAIELSRRGFDELTGCNATVWDLPAATREVDEETNTPYDCAFPVLLKPLTGAKILSMLHHAAFALAKESVPLAPGAVQFRNKLGGEVISFYGKMGDFRLGTGLFALLDVRFKERLVKWYHPEIWYPEDAPVTLHLFKDRGHSEICILNRGLDTLEGVPLEGLGDRKSILMLQPDGAWKETPVENKTIQCNIAALDIAFFRL